MSYLVIACATYLVTSRATAYPYMLPCNLTGDHLGRVLRCAAADAVLEGEDGTVVTASEVHMAPSPLATMPLATMPVVIAAGEAHMN